MSKKSKSKRSNAIPLSIARPAVGPIKISSSMAPLKALSNRLRLIEDRRTFSFAGPHRSARSTSSAHHQLVVKKAPVSSHRGFSLSPHVAFHAPKKVLICVRRKTRREVLFAKNRYGGHHKKPRRNFFSSVSCR